MPGLPPSSRRGEALTQDQPRKGTLPEIQCLPRESGTGHLVDLELVSQPAMLTRDEGRGSRTFCKNPLLFLPKPPERSLEADHSPFPGSPGGQWALQASQGPHEASAYPAFLDQG